MKECVIYNVALVVFAFDDPVAGECFTLADTRKENGGMRALPCFYEERSACSKGPQVRPPGRRCFADEHYLTTEPVKIAYLAHKKAVWVRM